MRNFTSKAAAALFGMMMLAANANAQSNIVISKVFYAGTTKINATTNYTGGEEYIELHNNGDTEQNLAGMFIGLVESESSTGAYLAKDREKGYEIKLKQLYQIPEDKDYKIAPWGTVVIAACAKDHSTEAQNGPDLSKADFSFGSMTGDNEAVTKLNLLFTFNASTKAVNLTNGGDAGLVIVKKANAKYLTYSDESTYVFANGKDKGSQYLPFNAYYAMDAVEILKTTQTEGVYAASAERKRFADSQDQGFVPADQKMNKDGYIAYRKTALAFDGNLYLCDSNNSTEDFMVSNTIGVKEYNNEITGVTSTFKVTIPESGFLPFKAEKNFFTDRGLYMGYVSITSGKVSCNSKPGNETIATNATYLLIGKPGEYNVSYTDAVRTLATAGADYWLEDGNEHYADGVYTETAKNRFPMKFVNEKGNPRFVQDMVDGNAQTMKIDLEKEGRFFIKHNVDNVSELKWDGIMPEDIPTAISSAVVNTPNADNAVYNLQGVRMNAASLPAGIYIQGGKKFVVK